MFDLEKGIKAPCVPCTSMEQLLDMFDQQERLGINAQIEDAWERKKRGELSQQDFNAIKDRLKRKSYIAVWQGHSTTGRRLKSCCVPSGLTIYDKDHFSNPRGFYAEHIKGREKELGIFIAYVSPSLEGLKVVFKTPKGMSIEQSMAWFARQIGDDDYDKVGKDYSRAAFLVPRRYIIKTPPSLPEDTPPSLPEGEDVFAADFPCSGSDDAADEPASDLADDSAVGLAADNPAARGIPSLLSPPLHGGEEKDNPSLNNSIVSNNSSSGEMPLTNNFSQNCGEMPLSNNASGEMPLSNNFSPTRGGDKREGMPRETHESQEPHESKEPKDTRESQESSESHPPYYIIGEKQISNSPLPEGESGERGLSSRLFSLCMSEAGITDADLNTEGTRHNSLLAILSVGASRFMDKETLLKVLATHMRPENISNFNTQQLVDDFYLKYTEDNRILSTTQRRIFAQALHNTTPQKTVRFGCGSNFEEENPVLQKFEGELPFGFAASVRGIPNEQRWPVICAILPIAATYADGVTYRYCSGEIHMLQLMTIIVGEMASGKSVCIKAFYRWAHTLHEEDKRMLKEETEIKRKNKNRKQSERAIEIPHLPRRLEPFKSSEAQLCQRVQDADGHSICSSGEELDDMIQANQGVYGDKTPLCRVAFDAGPYSRDMAGEKAISIDVEHVRWNFMVMGTWGQFNKLFRKDNIENGLSSRVLIAEMPDNTFAPMPMYHTEDPAIQEEIDQACEILRSKQGFFDTPKIREAIYNWQERVRVKAELDCDGARGIYRKRAAVMGFRAGVLAFLLSDEKETPAVVNFATTVAQYAMEEQVKCFGRLLMDKTVSARAYATYKSANTTLFDRLPQRFTIDDVQVAKGFDTPRGTIKSCISRWKASGLITTDSPGMYHKKPLKQ